MTATVLVLTTVHWPDDTRIRERLIRTLSREFEILYATKQPGPSDRQGLTWIGLRGGRFRRNTAAMLVILRKDWDILVLHDPETIPLGLIARLFRRSPVVVDIHENVPATAYTRPWVPGVLRPIVSSLSRWLLRLAERALIVTLAEPGYRSLFARSHAVFPNYPDTSGYPEPAPDSTGEVVYLGDVTLQRGAGVAVEGCAMAGLPLRLIGRVADETRAAIDFMAAEAGLTVHYEGMIPNRDALRLVAQSAVAISPLLDVPNYRDSQPTKILEYLALGVPTVASDLPGTRSMVDGLAAVELLPPGDPAALSEAIVRSLQASVREQAARQANLVRDRFRWPDDEVRDFYRSLL